MSGLSETGPAGVAGTPVGNVQSVQGVAGGTAIPTSGTQLPATLGPKAGAASLSVVPFANEYETVAASQTAQVLGATGATGDYLSWVCFQPTATNAGTSTVLDNATVVFTITSGTLADLRPIYFFANAPSVSGAWKVTTGASMTATAFGDFT